MIMSSQKDERQLDELIRRTIVTEKPQFDADEWKRKYPNELKALMSRASNRKLISRNDILIRFITNPLVQFSVAALIFVAIAFVLFHSPDKRINDAPKIYIDNSPTQIISMMSMRRTYRQGGLDALDRQFRDTLDVLGPRSLSISITELLEGINGS